MIVIGLGSGRSGTASLAHLLNSQQDGLCFHEMNPSSLRWSGTPHPILTSIKDFEAILAGGDPSRVTVDLGRKIAAEAYARLSAMPRVRLIGDIAFYYLEYVEDILAASSQVRFVCLKRDQAQTVDSWLKKSELTRWRSKAVAERIACLITRAPYHRARNFWMDHDGSKWQHDPVWDKLFPKFPGPTRREAVEQYWDFYYARADELASKYPDVFRIVQTSDLEDRTTQHDVLNFCGVDEAAHIYTDAHKHKST